jgi:alpha-beta hydrolase superfamily lysophospholipase
MRNTLANPASKIGGVSFHWVGTSDKRMRQYRNLASPLLPNPTLILSPLNDSLVIPAKSEEICTKSPLCTLFKLPQGRHNVMHGIDATRNISLANIRSWFA